MAIAIVNMIDASFSRFPPIIKQSPLCPTPIAQSVHLYLLHPYPLFVFYMPPSHLKQSSLTQSLSKSKIMVSIALQDRLIDLRSYFVVYWHIGKGRPQCCGSADFLTAKLAACGI